ncbi:hypothetical protein CUMW_144830 [Citrus unshiu]|nr:hypothetical protein CUMW_144830 [Citrus unshiu]
MPGKLEELIEEINRQEDEKISCVIADGAMGWAMVAAEEMKIRRAAYLACSSWTTGLLMMKFISLFISRTAIKKHMIQLAPTMATIHSTKLGEWMLCKSKYDLEPGALALIPELLPLGQLLASNRLPFLWVVRPDMTDNSNDDAYQKGFQDGVGTRGQMVGCAPQQKVLSHPSIACFLRHCGWNPTTEGVSDGLPFLCWPYFAEQFLNESYICDIRKVGQRFNKTKMGSSQGKKLRRN